MHSVTKLPGNPTTYASKISKSCYSVENKWTKPSYPPPENVLWGGVVAGALGSAPRAFVALWKELVSVKQALRRWCVDRGLLQPTACGEAVN